MIAGLLFFLALVALVFFIQSAFGAVGEEKTRELVRDGIGPPSCTIVNFGRYDEATRKKLAEIIEGFNHRVDVDDDPYEKLVFNYGPYSPYRFGSESFIKSSLSGVIVSESGRVLTLAHGIGPESDNVIYIAWSYAENGPRMLYQAKVLRVDMALDIAVLEIVAAQIKFPYIAWGNSDEVKTGDEVFVVSSPLGLPFTFNKCEVAHAKRSKKILKALFNYNAPSDMMQLSGNLPAGSSGGPVFNEKGFLIGFVQSRIEKEPNRFDDNGGASGGEESRFRSQEKPININFVIPANKVKKWLESK